MSYRVVYVDDNEGLHVVGALQERPLTQVTAHTRGFRFGSIRRAKREVADACNGKAAPYPRVHVVDDQGQVVAVGVRRSGIATTYAWLDPQECATVGAGGRGGTPSRS